MAPRRPVPPSDVVIVAGSSAYPEYLEYQAYVGHPNRAFRREARRMAFYQNQAIQREIPEILEIKRGLVFSKETLTTFYKSGKDSDRDIADLIQVLIDDARRTEGDRFDVVLLSGPEDPKTFTLGRSIANSKMDRRGNPAPITMGQFRYTSLDNLKKHPTTTDELGL